MLILGRRRSGPTHVLDVDARDPPPAEDGEHGLARQNFAISLAAGLLAVLLGRVIGGLL